VRNACRQIAQTKERLNLSNTAGLLIICHNGNYGLEPEAAFNLISRALKRGQYEAIDQIIYFVSGMKIAGAGNELLLPWIPGYREGYKDIPTSFLNRLRDSWIEVESGLLKEPCRSVEVSDPLRIDDYKFTKE